MRSSVIRPAIFLVILLTVTATDLGAGDTVDEDLGEEYDLVVVGGKISGLAAAYWPHGYSYDYLDLFDPEFPPGEAPHEIARRPFGNISFANSDAGANAYSHVAIDEAWRAVSEFALGARIAPPA